MPLPTTAGTIYDGVRTLMNDQDGDVYLDAIIQPYLVIAYDDLRMECENANIPFTNKTSAIITVPANVKAIGDNNITNSPALPRDLVEIVEIYERQSGTNNDYMRMKPLRFLPKTDVETTFLECYAWQGQTIQLIGATGDIQVKIDYVSDSFTELSDKNSLIALFNSKNALKFRTSALCARYIGEDVDRSTELNSEAQRSIDLLENIAIKSGQGMPVRRRPFRSGFRSRNWYGQIG